MIKVNDSRSVIFLLENTIIVYNSQINLCDFSIEAIELGFEVPSVKKKFLGVKMTEKIWLWRVKYHETRPNGKPTFPHTHLLQEPIPLEFRFQQDMHVKWKTKNKVQHYNWELSFIWGQNENYDPGHSLSDSSVPLKRFQGRSVYMSS